MPAKMDSGRFGVKICKDEDCEQKIALMEEAQEPYISKDRMVVNEMSSSSCSISALIDRVQIVNLITIQFTIVTPIYADARVVIVMPPGLVVPENGGEVQNFAGSTTAQEYTVNEDGHVVIDNFVKTTKGEDT
jgi:hypothetical protein